MTATGERSDSATPPGTTFGGALAAIAKLFDDRRVAPSLLAIVALLAYGPYLAVKPLLDEQFILSFTKAAGTRGVSLGSFLAWRGFDHSDLWGPVTTLGLKLSHLLLFGAPFLLRAEGMLLHAATAIILFFVVARIVGGVAVPLICALIFTLYPLSPEAVLWLGGRGSELAAFFGVAALFSFQRGRSRWQWLIVSLACFTAAILSSASVWPLMFVFALYELFVRLIWKSEENVDSPLGLMGPLAFLLVTACYVAGTGMLWQLTTDAAPILKSTDIWSTVRGCIFPINESIWNHYARHYRFLYFLLAPLTVAWLVAFARSARFRTLIGFSAAWFVLSLLPALGHVDARGTMYGSHILYPASLPLAFLLASLFASVPFVIPRRQYVGHVVAGTLVAVISVFYLSHLWKQNAAYDSGGRLAAALQKSVKVVHERTRADNVVVRALPQRVAIGPGFSTKDVVVFDGATALLASNVASSGALKDQLRADNLVDVVLRWDPQLKSPIRLDLGETAASPFAELNGAGIAQRMQPSIEYYKIAHLDQQSGEVVLESNSPTSGAAIRLSAAGLSPLGPDFLYIDAKIDGPMSGRHPTIELYWTTFEHPDYDNKQRRVWTMALVGDGQYHRYYLPLRSMGWVMDGPATSLTLGFPAASKVWLRTMGAADKSQVVPTLRVLNANPLEGRRYNPPFLNFPTRADLGLYRFEPAAKSVKIDYSCENIAGAVGVLFEISMPDQTFANTNGNEASGVGSTALGAIGTHGTYDLPMSSFPLPGLYSVRAIAVDRGHNQLGNFSDDMYCLVTHPYRSQWSQ